MEMEYSKQWAGKGNSFLYGDGWERHPRATDGETLAADYP